VSEESTARKVAVKFGCLHFKSDMRRYFILPHSAS
jgi:hypothetical protein